MLTNWDILDLFFRFSAIGILLLMGGLTLRRHSHAGLARTFAGLCFGGACYIFASSGLLMSRIGPFDTMLAVLSSANVFLFWLMTQFLFTDEFRMRLWHWGLLALALVLGGMRWAAFVKGWGLKTPMGLSVEVLNLGFVAHAVFTAWQGGEADLVEWRREFRSWFVALISPLIFIIVSAEIWFTVSAGQLPANRAETFAAFAIWAVTIFLAAQLLTLGEANLVTTLSRPARPVGANGRAAGELPAADRLLLARLRAAMEGDEAFRSEGLTIAALAERIDVPEHVLRRLINGHLGFRNFNSFLNSYRITAVKQALADPAQARKTMLELAYQAGFNSAGPFNRAFREACGETPSVFRKRMLARAEAPIPE